MKFETLKKKVADDVRKRIMRGLGWENILLDLVASGFAAKKDTKKGKAIEAYADKAHEAIMNFDVRCVGKLRELFPESFPRSLSKGALVCGYDDNLNWVVTIP